uniref:Ig-like domain-containing protein n=1 Tax=Maylandia zebra TaxID=106582 RepID=A0A3P9CDV1_9CICH
MSLLFSGSSEDLLTPSKDVVTSLEGGTVTLSCNYSAAGDDYFFWYRQYPGKPPEFLISHSGTGVEISDPVPGINFNVSEDKTLMTLQISSAAVSDSAVYYCAGAHSDRKTAKLCTKTFGAKTTEYSTTSTRGSHTLLHFSGFGSCNHFWSRSHQLCKSVNTATCHGSSLNNSIVGRGGHEYPGWLSSGP